MLKPGGRFLCLEFSRLTAAALRPLYDAYSFKVIPRDRRAGRRRRARPTSYLVESIRRFPDQKALAEADGRGRLRAGVGDQLHRRRRGPAPGLGDLAALMSRLGVLRAARRRGAGADPRRRPDPARARPAAAARRAHARRGSCACSRAARAAPGGPASGWRRRWSGSGRWRSSSASSSRPAPTSSAPTSPRTSSRLKDRLPPFPTDAAPGPRSRAALGRPFEACSPSSTSRSPPPRWPRRTAARLVDGRKVAVKVLRPGIERAGGGATSTALRAGRAAGRSAGRRPRGGWSRAPSPRR